MLVLILIPEGKESNHLEIFEGKKNKEGPFLKTKIKEWRRYSRYDEGVMIADDV